MISLFVKLRSDELFTSGEIGIAALCVAAAKAIFRKAEKNKFH